MHTTKPTAAGIVRQRLLEHFERTGPSTASTAVLAVTGQALAIRDEIATMVRDGLLRYRDTRKLEITDAGREQLAAGVTPVASVDDVVTARAVIEELKGELARMSAKLEAAETQSRNAAADRREMREVIAGVHDRVPRRDNIVDQVRAVVVALRAAPMAPPAPESRELEQDLALVRRVVGIETAAVRVVIDGTASGTIGPITRGMAKSALDVIDAVCGVTTQVPRG